MSEKERTRLLNRPPDGLQRVMKQMPARKPPVHLTTQLRVLASRELTAKQASLAAGGTWIHFLEKIQSDLNTLMRPLAIPTAGGFLAALLLFGMLAPSLMIPGVSPAGGGVDVPTGLYTGASVRSFGSVGAADEDFDVEVTIDGQGRIVDYNIPSGKLRNSPILRRAIEKHLLFTQFYPATSFGQPMTGKARLSFRSSRIDVKG